MGETGIVGHHGTTLAAGFGGGGRSSGVVLWDVQARQRRADAPFPVREGDVEGVAFSPDGTTLAAGYFGVGGGYQDFDTGNKSTFQSGRSARAPSVDAFVGVSAFFTRSKFSARNSFHSVARTRTSAPFAVS